MGKPARIVPVSPLYAITPVPGVLGAVIMWSNTEEILALLCDKPTIGNIKKPTGWLTVKLAMTTALSLYPEGKPRGLTVAELVRVNGAVYSVDEMVGSMPFFV